MRRVSKKADLSLSTNAIVVMIIAIVILGLALTFSRGIFTKLGEALSGIGGQTISNPATYDDPITLSTANLEIVRGKKMPLSISVFNKFSTGECGTNPVPTPGQACRIPITIVMPQCVGYDPNDYTRTQAYNYAVGMPTILPLEASLYSYGSLYPQAPDYTQRLVMLPVSDKQVTFSDEETYSTEVEALMGMPAGSYACTLLALGFENGVYSLLVQEDLLISVR